MPRHSGGRRAIAACTRICAIKRLNRGAALGVALALAACGGTLGGADSATPWPASVSAASYLPDTGSVHPVKVVSVSGSVTGADALLTGGALTLKYVAGGTAPTVVLDYGHEVGGLPTFGVAAQSGEPTLSATFSESRTTATTGDVSAGLTVSVDPQRTSLFPLSATGTIQSSSVQGGERYETLSLATPGEVTLDSVAIQSLYVAPTATTSATRGSFVSSSDTLNRIWAAGAYTVEMDRLAATALPLAWQVSTEGMTIGTSGTGIVQKSGAWPSDYAMAFDVRVNRNSAGWTMRDSGNLTSLRFVLHSASDTQGTPNTLELDAYSTFAGGAVKLGELPVSAGIATGAWHSVSTSVSGNTVSVTLDGANLGTLDASGAASILLTNYGSAGFFNVPASQATYRNLAITANGASLYANTLMTSSALDDFSANTNALPLLIDGAKRDRTVWSGDIAVELPTVFYTTAQSDAVAGSIRLLGSYRLANGEVSTTHSPQDPLIGTVADAYGSSNFYSTQYSMYFVTVLHDYYLYSGDAALLAQQWSAAQGELSYLQTQVDSNGLISVDASNAQDWLPDFASPVVGEVASTNMLYYQVLSDAAELAAAMGDASTSSVYAQRAATLKQAINARLYNAAGGYYGMSATSMSAVAQDANALAVVTGVASPSSAATVLASVAQKLANPYGRLAFSSDSRRTAVVSPFASDMEVRARLASGDTRGALSLIDTLWGNMIADGDNYTGTVWEALGTNGLPVSSQTSLAHGWSSGPTSALSRYVLGVRPVAAGFKQWLIKPQTGDLQWATGTTPTPYGAIAVKWGRTQNGVFRIDVTVPAGTTGSIALPAGGTVKVNGAVSAASSTSALDPGGVASDGSAYQYLNGVGPGSYSIVVGG
ncbi:alpha-L-rhamnosidase C-terminal domain-containing protein [Burkholderia sp. Ax-1719]|uniref:alpha-L-rhamnosidase-related protein n=1 Tax=Burkholderia sp. Ax-1719 TaxID=2608334 RepID=UPI0014235C20|nr:alpha-L-rhamnosidase C-terminal domain-containing protein [Burkholderia sp. Ax-1719]